VILELIFHATFLFIIDNLIQEITDEYQITTVINT